MTNRSLDAGRLPVIHEAAADFFYLMTREYPRDASLKLVGDRFELTGIERELLGRGVFGRRTALRRRSRRMEPVEVAGRVLVVDGHNVHIIVESGLLGRPLLLANDGAMRDLAGLSSAFRYSETAPRAVESIFRLLQVFRPARLLFLFDAPMSHSGRMAAEYRRRMEELEIPGDARAVPVPEREIPYGSALVAGSDREVLDRATAWVDLAQACLALEGLAKPFADFSDLC